MDEVKCNSTKLSIKNKLLHKVLKLRLKKKIQFFVQIY